MNQLKDIKERLSSVLDGGDILIIIPPFAIKDYSILGPHIIHALAAEMGYKADILYANILLASIIGEDIYDGMSKFAYDLRGIKLGERLFARSAHGLPPLGKFSESGTAETVCIENVQQHIKMSYESEDFDMARLLEIEEICFSFIDEIVRAISPLEYNIVGCTSTLEQNNCSVAILKGIKEDRPDTITLVGGANCEGEMAEGILSLSETIDYVFSGESEFAFKEFLKGYSKGELPSRRIITGEPIRDLDTIPLPDYESYFEQTRQFLGENKKRQKIVSYETSRGCWRAKKGGCFFCGGILHNHLFRQKSIEKVVKDLEQISDTYPVTNIAMTDNIVSHFYYKKLLPILSEKKEFPPIWYQENTNLKLADLIKLKKANINSLLLGVEALETGLLKLMNKGTTAKQNLLLLRNTLSIGIAVTWQMLWGFPGDKTVHYEETLKLLPLIRHLPPPIELVHLKLARFSSFVDNPQRHQITNPRPLEIYRHVYPDWADTDKLATYYTGDYPCESHENPGLIRELADKIAAWKKSWESGHERLVMIQFAGYFVIQDSRDIPGTSKMHTLDFSQAKEIMKYHRYTGSENQKWAVGKKLGVVVDSWYVPLVTASVELLLKLEE